MNNDQTEGQQVTSDAGVSGASPDPSDQFLTVENGPVIKAFDIIGGGCEELQPPSEEAM